MGNWTLLRLPSAKILELGHPSAGTRTELPSWSPVRGIPEKSFISLNCEMLVLISIVPVERLGVEQNCCQLLKHSLHERLM